MREEPQLEPPVDAQAWSAARRAFTGAAFDHWARAVEDFSSAPQAGPILLDPLVRASVAVVAALGPEAALALVPAARKLAGLAGGKAVRAFLQAVPRAASHLETAAAFEAWLAVLQDLAQAAPDCLPLVAERSEALLSRHGFAGLAAWLRVGMAETLRDPLRRAAYFSLEDPAALHVLEQEASDVSLALMERRLKGLLAALWRLHPALRPLAVERSLQAPRRATFDGLLLRLPESFAGFRGPQAARLYKAAATHIGAHLESTAGKFKVKARKPVQIALVSLIEDARFEALAAAEFPGLLKLWRPFHVAENSGANLAEPLMARLARSLIDPDYSDPNPWVRKGRGMFLDSRAKWDDPAVIREIGVLLGNDFGQMRLQFNAKTYVVQPPYRDDNLGLWDFGTPPEQTAEDDEVIHESVRIEQTEDLEQEHQRQRQEARDAENGGKAKVALVEEEGGIPVASYGEWNYLTGRERPDWTTVVEYLPRRAPADVIARDLEPHRETLRRIKALIQQAQISRPKRLKRQPEGERLDLEAAVRAMIDRRSGIAPDTRVYESAAFLERDLSVLVLLDISESTKDLIQGAPPSVFAIERTATAILSQAMAALGDPFAVHAFCSDGRSDVRYYRLKDFAESYDETCRSRLAGLRPGYSTRMGAALRHAGREISGQLSYRRLVLLVTDGEPSDIDVEDQRYLVEDARKAVHDLAHQGIDVFCVGLEAGDSGYLTRIFGRRNFAQINRVGSLPEKLPLLYLRLTA